MSITLSISLTRSCSAGTALDVFESGIGSEFANCLLFSSSPCLELILAKDLGFEGFGGGFLCDSSTRLSDSLEENFFLGAGGGGDGEAISSISVLTVGLGAATGTL